jgi:phosphoglycerate dehydrogenase-like enzyme
MAAVGESVSAERRRVAEAGEGRRWKVFCSRNMPDVAFQLTREVADVDLWDGEDAPPHDVLLERLRDCDGFISLLTDRIDADLMDRCPRLKVITQLAVGFNNIDVAAATARGIYVTNTPDVLNVHPPPTPHMSCAAAAASFKCYHHSTLFMTSWVR